MAMVFIRGDIYAIWCSYIPKPHEKYSICINQENALFLWFNTEPRKYDPQTQLLVEKSELAFLDHDSYLDLSQPHTFPPDDLNRSRLLGNTPNSLKKRIVESVVPNRLLTPNQKNIIYKALKF